MVASLQVINLLSRNINEFRPDQTNNKLEYRLFHHERNILVLYCVRNVYRLLGAEGIVLQALDWLMQCIKLLSNYHRYANAAYATVHSNVML